MELADQFGLKDYEAPGGGCLLTDENFSNKIRDFIAHDTFSVEDIPTIKYGRQLRLPDKAKLIIGRNAEDNEILKGVNNPKYLHVTTELVGPHAMISRNASDQDKLLAAKMILAYCKPGFEGEQTLNFEGTALTTLSDLSRNDAQRYFI